jgi:cytochrome c oxidase subunit 1/cytochrome c oxidase subunit I+III
MAITADRLTHIWETPADLASRLATVDHKTIGVRYMITAFVLFLLGGVEALLLRTQLAAPNLHVLSPEAYNQLFTMHGTTMIFFFATPLLSGFGNYLIPLMIGSRDMAFPRLNSFGYWVFLFAGIFIYSSFLIGSAPDGGWFAYVPLTGPVYSPGLNLDFWALGVIFLGLSSTGGAINFIVTIFKLRAPGMSINRIPLFVWAVLVTSFAIIFALPPLTVACVLLELDRKLGTLFYNPLGGGNALLWQHLFWAFGHPDVYIIFLPAVGMVSEIVQTFSRRSIVAYTAVALSAVATGFFGFGVWVHHMFATGLPALSLSFFGAASMAIAIPSGVQIFAWLATIASGRPQLKTPFLFIVGFVIIFVLGGLTGVMFAVVPFDWQVTDTYFVVAHLHYVLIGGAVFPIFGGFYYWLPKMSGRLLSDTLGKLAFWLMFTGFNLAFFPMHISGLLGMPRRVYTYQAGLGWDALNLLSTIGAFVFALAVLVFMIDVLWSLRFGKPAGNNPWNAATLEWATSSPPPVYNFRIIPAVQSRDPLWDQPDLAREQAPDARSVPRLADGRETLATTLLDGAPEEALRMPGDSVWPMLLAFALAVIFFGLLLSLWLMVALGVLAAAICIPGWLWPSRKEPAV